MSKLICSGCKRTIEDDYHSMIKHTRIHLDTQIEWENMGFKDPIYRFPIALDKVDDED
jgi:hypothetical protein